MKKKLCSILFGLMLLISIFVLVACGETPVKNFNISFVVDGNVYQTISTNGNENISISQNPTKDGYTFDGWFFDENTWGKELTKNSIITTDTIVYAKFEINQYLLSYELNGSINSDDNPSTFTIEDKIELSNPTKEGFIFLGWFKENSYEPISIIDQGTTENIKLYAKFKEKTRINIKYKDADGTLLKEHIIFEDEPISNVLVPQNTEKWIYDSEWEEEKIDNTIIYQAKRSPNKKYFRGNVFQIVVKNINDEPIATGSGFVIDSNGTFITNSHVMSEAYSASAYFEISNEQEGETFTELPIEVVYYNSKEKDIFIGKIIHFDAIKENFHTFSFNTKHKIGEKTFSIGYPNSTTNMKIHEGYSFTDLTTIEDKINGNLSYIWSTSFIAPGSSGGILVDENLDIIGMTTCGITDDNTFIAGGSINAFNLYPRILEAKNKNAQYLFDNIHPFEKTMINIFNKISILDEASLCEDDGEKYYKIEQTQEGFTSDNTEYSSTKTIIIYTDLWFSFSESFIWEDGSQRYLSFYGYYDETKGINSFNFEFEYTFENGDKYSILSDNINYSDNLSLTLSNYSTTKSIGFIITENNITYAKNQFNILYLNLNSYLFNEGQTYGEFATASKRNCIIVGIAADYEPFSYKEENTYKGFEIDLIRNLASKINCEVEFVNVRFNELFSLLSNKSVTCCISGINETRERNHNFIPSYSYCFNNEEQYVIYFSQQNGLIAEYFNDILTESYKNGELNKILLNYNITDFEVGIKTTEPSEIILDQNQITILKNDSIRLTASIVPITSLFSNLIWETDNSNVAIVSNGIITGINEGTTTIRVKYNDSIYATCEVTVIRKREYKTIILTKANYTDYLDIYCVLVGNRYIRTNVSTKDASLQFNNLQVVFDVSMNGQWVNGSSSMGAYERKTITSGEERKDTYIDSSVSGYTFIPSSFKYDLRISGTVTGYVYVD